MSTICQEIAVVFDTKNVFYIHSQAHHSVPL
jgi:hypothetical protein